MTQIVLFNEYNGKDIPNLPFDYVIKRSERKMEDVSDIYKTNIKVFEKNTEKRKIILEIFCNAGFVLLYDCTTHTTRNSNFIRLYDRLVFNG